MEHNKTIDLSVEAARHILPILEARLEDLSDRVEAAHSEFENAKHTIAEIRAKLNGSLLPGIVPERKRKRRGEADKLITELLGGSNTGFKIQEVVKRTGIPYSSVFRILKQKNKGRFIEENGVWKMKK